MYTGTPDQLLPECVEQRPGDFAPTPSPPTFVPFSCENEKEAIVFDVRDGFQSMFLLLISMPHGTLCSPARQV